ncbi:MAG: hypothetical protein KGY81_05225 [Phycisphaerae bacterium]|nr:hypothetical protein [Phycisphaerae bacterium]
MSAPESRLPRRTRSGYHATSTYLAGKDVNIIALYGDRKGDECCVLTGQVEVPDQSNLALLQVDLERMGTDERFTVRIQHENIVVATKQIRLTRRQSTRPQQR